MNAPLVTVVTSDLALGTRIQVYLEKRHYSTDVRYPWSPDTKVESPAVTIVDTRDEWGRSASGVDRGPLIQLRGERDVAMKAYKSLPLPVQAWRLREAVEGCLQAAPGAEPRPSSTSSDSGWTLGGRSFAHAFVQCREEQFSGRVVIKGTGERTLWFDDGLVVAAVGGFAEERLGPVLTKLGLIHPYEVPIDAMPDEALAERLLAERRMSVVDYIGALERQVQLRTIAALGEVAPTVRHFEGTLTLPETLRNRPASWVDTLVESTKLHHGAGEVSKMVGALRSSGHLVPTALGRTLSDELAVHPNSAPVWTRVLDGGQRVKEVVEYGRSELNLVASLLCGGLIELDYQRG